MKMTNKEFVRDLINRLREAKFEEEKYAMEQDFWHGELLGEAAEVLASIINGNDDEG